jgi:hypothetical protein
METETQTRRDRARAIARELKAMTDAERAALAARVGVVTIEGRPLSFRNTCLLAFQNAAVTVVGGYRQWQTAGRQVRKGEHGLMIWIPTTRKAPAAPEGAEGEDETRFLVGTVFDIAQTDPITTIDDGMGGTYRPGVILTA